MDFSNINFLAVAVAAIASFALGSLWYTVLFGKRWQKEAGLSDETIRQGNMAVTFGSSFAMMFVMALGLAVLLGSGDTAVDWRSGMMTGLFVGLFFVATSAAINYVYQRKSLALWAIDVTYQVLFLMLSGLIIGSFN